MFARRDPTERSDPVPGFDGTYSGTCIVCLRPTDTALAAQGPRECFAAVLVVLGIPYDQCITIIDGMPDGSVQAFSVCAACAAAVGLEVALAVGGNVPLYLPPDGV